MLYPQPMMFSLVVTMVMVFGAVAMSNAAGTAGFRFASYYASHMVLQRGPQKAGLWGYAPEKDIGQTVKVTVSGSGTTGEWATKTYAGPVKKGPFKHQGMWVVALDPENSTTPFTITAELPGQPAVKLQDVLFGDVWVCSGQSNMQFGVVQMFESEQELTFGQEHQAVRMFVSKRVISKSPLYDLEGILMQWTPPKPGGRGWGAFSAVCWLYGKRLQEELGYPIGLIDSTWGGTPVEAWSSPDALHRCHIPDSSGADTLRWLPRSADSMWYSHDGLTPPQGNSVLWNAMIHPFTKMTIKGAIWYQGEQNGLGQGTNVYNCTFPAMIQDWRAKFDAATSGRNDDFPFGFVQIGPMRTGSQYTWGYADIRWHQTADYGYVPNRKMPNTFMAVSMDLEDPDSPYGSVHYRDKMTTASRLTIAALKSVYGKSHYAMADIPTPMNYQLNNTMKTLTITYNSSMHLSRRSYDGFEVCCSESRADCPQSGNRTVWQAAPLHKNSVSPHTVTLSWHICNTTTIAALRYSWLESPCQYKYCAIYNNWFGLPASPFVHYLTT